MWRSTLLHTITTIQLTCKDWTIALRFLLSLHNRIHASIRTRGVIEKIELERGSCRSFNEGTIVVVDTKEV
ncbi:hypothetical protein [Stenomitos frigidus]|uniref:hypothetical protein n=1 Tax=Stenomitos frigidus TaxID=1886765 RepID=UPI0011B20226|nr:hypothetical protein [Stenomitos frigidus]